MNWKRSAVDVEWPRIEGQGLCLTLDLAFTLSSSQHALPHSTLTQPSVRKATMDRVQVPPNLGNCGISSVNLAGRRRPQASNIQNNIFQCRSNEMLQGYQLDTSNSGQVRRGYDCITNIQNGTTLHVLSVFSMSSDGDLFQGQSSTWLANAD